MALVGHGFLWAGVVNRLHGFRGPRPIIKALTVVSVLAFVGLPLAGLWQWLTVAEANVSELVRQGGWSVWYGLACAGVGVASLAVKPWVERQRYDRRTVMEWKSERRDAPKHASAPTLVGPYARLLGSMPGNEVLALSIDRKRLAVPRLPAELDGLTIAHLSDFHMTGRIGRDYFAHVARVVNELRPDVIAITGDIIEHESCRPWLADSLGQLCAPLGVYFVLGNHDEFVDADRTRAMLVDLGLTCLSGRWVRAEWNGVPVRLGGNELPWMPAANLTQLPRRAAGAADFRLVLCHTPDQFAWCCRADADLVLAGHTHGGQVQLPLLGILGSPSLYGTRYACGVFRRGNTVMHVTRGISGVTPFRWRCPPEAALLELTRAPLSRKPAQVILRNAGGAA
jgi:predicted MPP superfamily phosphohydrolase